MGLFGKKKGETATSKDPVCGMDVDPAKSAGKAVHAGTTYQFCSKSCLAKFNAAPQKFVKA